MQPAFKQYSVNESYSPTWDPRIREYIEKKKINSMESIAKAIEMEGNSSFELLKMPNSIRKLVLEKNILSEDPFQTIDMQGVGALLKIAIEKGRNVNPKIKIGIC